MFHPAKTTQEKTTQTNIIISPDGYTEQHTFIEELLQAKSIKAPKEIIEIIINVLQVHPLLSEAAIVELANKLSITMFGKEISNVITDTPGRKVYNLHPYRKGGSGAVCMASYTGPDNECYVLFGQKTKAPELLILLGGYFQPYPLAGHREGIEKLTSEQKDAIEEAIISGIVDAYQASSTNPSQDSIIASVIKWDHDVSACAVRELAEESKLEGIDPEFLMEQSCFPDTNPDLHSINLSYLFDYGDLVDAPTTLAGSDIKELTWIKAKDIEVIYDKEGKSYRSQGMLIRKDHGPILEAGIRRIIEKKINNLSDGLLTLSTLEAKIKSMETKAGLLEGILLGKKPKSHLGNEANCYLIKMYTIAGAIKKASDAEDYFGIADLKRCLASEKYLNYRSLSPHLLRFGSN